VAALNTWSEVPGGGITDVAVAATETPGYIYLVGEGSTTRASHLSRYDAQSDTWSGSSEVPGGGGPMRRLPQAALGTTATEPSCSTCS
jgi:hypothetical protein